MAQEYKLKDLTSFASLNFLDKIEAEIEGIPDGKVLLVKLDDKVHALSPRCSHYGAPLKNGVVTSDGRITCPWHGACFNVTTGDVEDAPAPNALNKFEVFEKEGAVYIRAREEDVKAGQRNPVVKCSVTKPEEKVIVVGGGSGTLGLIQALRELKYPGQITIITREPYLIIDRTKLSKALIADPAKIQWRPREWYTEAAIETLTDEVTSVDFEAKSVSTKSGKNLTYTKLVLATGGIPRTLPLPGFKGELSNIFTLRGIKDVQAILAATNAEENKKKNIVVIGSSFIGMEVGNALSKDHNVTIVGMESAPMERIMGTQVGRIFQQNLEKNNVKFYLNAGVEKATPSPSNPSSVGAVHLKDGTSLPADLVILGVGVRPATDFLESNKEITLEKDGSIKTTAHYLVDSPHKHISDSVFAIGDIATYPYYGPGSSANGSPIRIEHWNVAQNSGRATARAIVHALHSPISSLPPKRFIPVFWSALGAQLRYCGTGAVAGGYDDVVFRDAGDGKFTAFYTMGEVVVAVATMGVDPVMSKSVELMRAGKMLGKAEVKAGGDVLSVNL
ncbi:hypothetical protein N7499_009247 [Penicillium canescens]|uniref:Rieske domain-containing protein n=1 Tax=Penicillium canescens TaxID=5083 RepID=A0AAD6INU5_PENCN|nr:uncharacterized protein N7446_008728 [Penicillium canescens]KAJ5981701.1 hypothetical protein N7522_013329 [Penicillium canescens]KAJ6057832.1 hypothetical protein N7460_001106 [Penicillium canescens]KAJ6059145.1 hypothetical protein N7446_008728 [Penicillium canescens]KAJ6071233.1 hypothetical protein N7499_009247 [Penicillium canescens]KAJ6169914.1 hypothetical protein N7485_007260 [Penicillium canescens]